MHAIQLCRKALPFLFSQNGFFDVICSGDPVSAIKSFYSQCSDKCSIVKSAIPDPET